MKRIILTGILYSKKNYDLSYRLRGICKRYSLNLVNAIDFVELTIKCLELKPQVVFCDCSTIEFTSGNLNAFLEKNEFKDTRIVFIGQDNDEDKFKNLLCKNLSFAKFSELETLIDNLQNDYDFENIVVKNIEIYDGLELEICKMLSDLGLSPKHSGYLYLRYSIKSVVLNNGVLDSLNSEHYPIIASVFKTSPANVERNIRNAICQAWLNSGKNNWHEVFFLKSIKDGKKPTNREFIYMCSEIIISQHKIRQYIA